MLEIYQREECPYCKKVRARSGELGLSRVAHSAEVSNRIPVDHKVPFLVDAKRGVMLPESEDIIEYLDKNYV